ncbi:MAG: hypothetical protein DRG78_09730 [Epsilonproteobacteria bacterium]|nr:MAG: hypothetical protein DRG78_09730 [Campylobacterota bacterium]
MIAIVIISLIFTSLSLRYVRVFVNLFNKKHTEILEEPMINAGIQNHVIICGYSLLGQKIVKNLKNFDVSYVAIEHDRQLVKKGKEKGDIVFFGNAASKVMLNSLFLKDASAVIIAIDNDNKIRLITEAIKSINPTINIIVKVTHQSQIDEFKDLNINGFVNENEIVAYELIKKAMQCKIN